MNGTPATFWLDAGWWQSDPVITDMDPASQGGLINLLTLSWAMGCRLPADDDALARASGLNEAWMGSELRRNVLYFFEPMDEYLRCAVLWPQFLEWLRGLDPWGPKGQGVGSAPPSEN